MRPFLRSRRTRNCKNYKALYPIPGDIGTIWSAGSVPGLITTDADWTAFIAASSAGNITGVISNTHSLTLPLNIHNTPASQVMLRGQTSASKTTANNISGMVVDWVSGVAGASKWTFKWLNFSDTASNSGTCLTFGDNGTHSTLHTNIYIYECNFAGAPYQTGIPNTSGYTFTGSIASGTIYPGGTYDILTLASVPSTALGAYHTISGTGINSNSYILGSVGTNGYLGGGSGPNTIGATYAVDYWVNVAAAAVYRSQSATQPVQAASAGTTFTVTENTGYKAVSPGGKGGISAHASATTFSDCVLGYCTFTDLYTGTSRIKGTNFVMIGNTFDKMYTDATGWGGANPYKMYFNTFLRTIGRSDDAALVHADSWQFYDSTGGEDKLDGEMIGNIVFNYGSRAMSQGIFSSNQSTGFYFNRARTVGNLVINTTALGTDHEITLNRAKDTYNFGNKTLKTDLSGFELRVGYTEGAGANLFAYNAASGIKSGGVITSQNNTLASISTQIDGPANPTTVLDAISAARWNSGHFLRNYIDYTNFTIDTGLELGWVPLISKYGQSNGTLIYSNIAKLMGGPAVHSVAVSAGLEYQISSDSAGSSVVTPWTSANGSMARGNFIQVRATSAATSNTPNTHSLTINGYTNYWNVVTLDTSAFPFVTATAGSYSTGTIPTSSYSKFIFAIRVKMTSATANQILLNGSAGTNYTWQSNIFQLGNSGQIRKGLGTLTQNSIITRIVSIDTQYTTTNYPDMTANECIEAGFKAVDIDWATGVATVKSMIGAVWVPNSTYNLNSFNTMGLLNNSAGSGVNFVGDFHFLWINGYSSNMPDITDPRVYTKFGQSLMASSNNGSTSVGDGFDLPQPLIFFGNPQADVSKNNGFALNKTGSAASSNLGTLAVTMTTSVTGYI